MNGAAQRHPEDKFFGNYTQVADDRAVAPGLRPTTTRRQVPKLPKLLTERLNVVARLLRGVWRD